MGFAPIKWTCTAFFRPRQLTDRAILAIRQTQEKKRSPAEPHQSTWRGVQLQDLVNPQMVPETARLFPSDRLPPIFDIRASLQRDFESLPSEICIDLVKRLPLRVMNSSLSSTLFWLDQQGLQRPSEETLQILESIPSARLLSH